MRFINESDPRETVKLLLECLERGEPVCPQNQRLPQHLREAQKEELRTQACVLDPHLVLWTSGTTASPKAACFHLSQIQASAEVCAKAYDLEKGDRWLLALPLYHIAGIAVLYRCLAVGAHWVFAEKAVEEHLDDGVTHLSLVPTQLKRLLKSWKPAWSSSLKCVLVGGAVIPKDLILQAQALHIPLICSYGMTEMSSSVAITHYTKPTRQQAGEASILPHVQAKMCADGEILLDGPSKFLGYWHGEAQEKRPYATGDLGEINKDGYLQLKGRRDNLIISGGENIQAEEVEAVLLQHPLIRAVKVRGQADEEYGERPCAYIDSGDHLSLEDLQPFLDAHLARFKHPVALRSLVSERRDHSWKGHENF